MSGGEIAFDAMLGLLVAPVLALAVLMFVAVMQWAARRRGPLENPWDCTKYRHD